MERLTERTGEGKAIPRMDLKNNGHQKCMERLAEYEDLEERLQNVYGDHHGLLDEVVAGLERHEKIDLPQQVIKSRLLTDESVDQWEEYKTLDKQGKLLKLPCAVGDTVYVLEANMKNFNWNHIKGKITKAKFDYWMIPRFGSLVFLTREEAEAALKETQE